MDSEDLVFEMEIREVKSKKLVTNDIEFTIRLTTSDSRLLDLGKLPADETVKVRITKV